jgi:hypothetical protein
MLGNRSNCSSTLSAAARPTTDRTNFARLGNHTVQNTAQEHPKPEPAGSRAAILALKTPQVSIYSPELRRFEGRPKGATPH